MSQAASFSGAELPALAEYIDQVNPWWRDEPAPPVRVYQRWPLPLLVTRLQSGVTPAVVLRGPRRVGKTVLLRQVLDTLLSQGIASRRVLYLPFDELPDVNKLSQPLLSIAYWFERRRLGCTFNEAARNGAPAFLFLDEVQNLDAWAPQLKSLVDNHEVRVFVTGSSSLRIEAGRDSLAGRISTLTLGTLLLREIAGLRFGRAIGALMPQNGLDAFLRREFWEEAKAKGERERDARAAAFRAFSERGGYPSAHERYDVPWPEMADQLNESVIQRAIRHDLRGGRRGRRRDEDLLNEVFRLACRYAGQAPGPDAFVPEVRQILREDIGWNRVLNYLRLLDETLLLRLIPSLELRLKKRGAPNKIALCDPGLRAAWLQEVIPLDSEGLAAAPHLADLAGRIAESVLGYFLTSIPNLDVAYYPARGIEPEMDFILTIGTRRIPIEVKYRKRIDPHEDTRGLRAFLEKTVYNAPFGLLVTLDDDVIVHDPRIIPISLSSLLWVR
jgi:predicted AAA+ superfamily ATPase